MGLTEHTEHKVIKILLLVRSEVESDLRDVSFVRQRWPVPKVY